MEWLYFIIGLGIGTLVGALVYRNNAKKFQKMAKDAIERKNDALIELDKIRRKLVGASKHK